MTLGLKEMLIRLEHRPERSRGYVGSSNEAVVTTFLEIIDDTYAAPTDMRAVAVEVAYRWARGLLAVQAQAQAEQQRVLGARVLEHNGHCFPLRGNQNEPDEVVHCVHCGVSYAGTGPTMSEPCEPCWVSIEKFAEEEGFDPEFLAQARDEYRHAAVAAENHDLCWFDGILPRWEFYRRTGGGFYVGIDEEYGDSVEGATEEAVYQAAVDLDMQRVEEMFEGEDEEQGV